MKKRPSIPSLILPALLCGLVLSGCTTFHKRSASATEDNSFITYWPSSGNDGQLRLAVKDLIDMKGVVTTAGSEFLAKNSPPAVRDAKCLAIARRRNVQIVGKTNTSELAVAASGINAYFGTPKNPVTRKRDLIPGGSSSGSAVVVATGQADIAFGTDTAGSIRVPAACCGLAGLKTTHGLVPLDGVYPIAPSELDTVGPIARDVAGLVQGMDLLENGFAGKYRAATRRSGAGIKVGRLYVTGTDPKVDRAVDVSLERAGFTIVRMSPAFKAKWDQAEKDAQTIAAASAWVYHQKFKNEPQVASRTKLVIALGEVEYNTNYRGALERRLVWRSNLRQALTEVDFIALPTLQNLPPQAPLFGGTVAFEGKVLSLQNTEAVNLAGNPALAVPIPVDDKKVPVTSLQLIGRWRGEAALLNAGRLVEEANGKALIAASERNRTARR